MFCCCFPPLQRDESQQHALGANAQSTLQSILFTCLFLAAKVGDQVHALGLLRYMLSSLAQGSYAVSEKQATDVEARCLAGLGWRLGPYFAEGLLDEVESNGSSWQ